MSVIHHHHDHPRRREASKDRVRLEEQLDEIDSKVSSKAYPDQHNGSFRTDAHQFQDRSELMVEIQAKLREYGKTWVVYVIARMLQD